jgi:hypothetical protein
MIFVDRYTVRITGKVIEHGPNRKGHPVSSAYEARKRDKKRTGQRNWQDEFKSTNMTIEEIKDIAETTAAAIENEKKEVEKLRRYVSRLQKTQILASHSNARSRTKDSYGILKNAREEVRDFRSKLLPREKSLRNLRQDCYFWNNIVRYGKSSHTDRSKSKVTEATWSHFSVEDNTEVLDVTRLIATQGKKRQIVFSGTDYGVCKMSETVPQTLNGIIEHINRYQVLGKFG